MCSCGCNTCGGKAPILNEGITFQQPLSENLLYHIKNKKPLTENTFRYGSPAFLNLWKEARTLYSRNILDVGPEDKEILLETNLGEYALFEGNLVPLDLPMLEEEQLEELNMKSSNVKEVLRKLYTDPGLVEFLHFKDFKNAVRFIKSASLDDWHDLVSDIKQYETTLTEVKHKGENVHLNKPHRGGAKKFYVYVRDPKTKNIKKVSFGDTTGLKAKINNPKARKAFAERHNCKDKKDKTKAGYWACRLPRYAKLLGLKGSYSGYW